MFSIGEFARLGGVRPISLVTHRPCAGTDNGLMIEVDPGHFEEMVITALDGLPEEFGRLMQNVAVIVEHDPGPPGLLGLYQGIPLTSRGVLPTGWHPGRRKCQTQGVDRKCPQSRRPKMRSATYDLTISTARADALFASALQRSDQPTVAQVHGAIAAALAAFGIRGCAARVAQAYGDHPETAVQRMRWARAAVTRASDGVRAGSACVPGPRQAHLSCAA